MENSRWFSDCASRALKGEQMTRGGGAGQCAGAAQRAQGRKSTSGTGDDLLEEGGPCAFETPVSLRHVRHHCPGSRPLPVSEPHTASPNERPSPDCGHEARSRGLGQMGGPQGTSSRELTAARSQPGQGDHVLTAQGPETTCFISLLDSLKCAMRVGLLLVIKFAQASLTSFRS